MKDTCFSTITVVEQQKSGQFHITNPNIIAETGHLLDHCPAVPQTEMGEGAEVDVPDEKQGEVPRGTLADDKPKKRKRLMRGGAKKRKKRKT